MPRRCASCGEPIRTGVPLTRISPSSAESAPERIFISVDLPAPFSPTSTRTSPAASVSDTSDNARTPGKLFPMPRISSSGVKLWSRGVCARVRSDRNLYDRLRRLAAKIGADDVDRRRADLRRILNGIAVHIALRDGGARFGRGVVTDDRNLTRHPGRFHCCQRAERRVVFNAEDAFEIAMRLQNVAGVAVRFAARAS